MKQASRKSQFYRAGVGAVIVNGRGDVLALERSDVPVAWQLPQGGIKEGEEPIDAVRREIEEETGIASQYLTLIREHPDFLTYELPPEYRSSKTGRGQTQRWFYFRFSSDAWQISLPAKGEFQAWKWMALENLIQETVWFRREIYRHLADEFTKSLKKSM